MNICCLSRLRSCCLILFSTLNCFLFCLGMQYIQSRLDDAQPQQLDNSTNSDDDEDDLFFSSRRKKNSFATDHLDQYLAAGRVGHHIHLSSLNAWPQLKSLFVELNTPLAASAACERLFSVAGLIFTPRRACLGDTNFENQLLLRLNKAFV